MMLLMLVATLLVGTRAEWQSDVAHCGTRLPDVNNHPNSGSAGNMDYVANGSPLALVSWDPRPAEKNNKCIKLTMDRAESKYSLSYKDSSNARLNATGSLGENRFFIPIIETGYSHYTMSGLPGGDFFNGGNMFLMHVGDQEYITETCELVTVIAFPPQIYSARTSYTFVPLQKAINNKACGCDDWSTA